MSAERRWLLSGAAMLALAGPATGQQPGIGTVPLASTTLRTATADGPADVTLSAAALLWKRRIPMTFHPLTPREQRDLRAAAESLFPGVVVPRPEARVRWLRPWTALWFNTISPHYDRDGAVWQGLGATVAASTGVALSYGPLSLDLQPVAFSTENRPFAAPIPGPRSGAGEFADPPWGDRIDQPWRFGHTAYSRLDLGESTARLSFWGGSLAATTAVQRWGPARFYPLVMGTEAGGYPRVQIETEQLNLGFTRLKALWSMGTPARSAFGHPATVGERRLLPALAISLQPFGLTGLEVGATRLYHIRRLDTTRLGGAAMLPFKGLLKGSSNPDDIALQSANQVGSVFARIAPPSGGVEVYGEYYRDDHNVDLRDLALQIDHYSAYMLGFRRAARSGSDGLRTLTVEMANGRISHLRRLREEAPPYIHFVIIEGHTHLGQVLGSRAVMGGGGLAISLDQTGPRQAVTYLFEMRRGPQNREGGTYDGRQLGEYVFRYQRTIRNGKRDDQWHIAFRRGYGAGERLALRLGLATTLLP